jgi:hypothetical protein
MLFNVDTCKVMHFGYNKSKRTYEMNGKDLDEIWRPNLRKDIKFIEGAQRRETKLLKSLKVESCANQLKKLYLTTIETRRLQGDSIEVFKMFNRMDNLDAKKSSELTNAPIWGHPLN